MFCVFSRRRTRGTGRFLLWTILAAVWMLNAVHPAAGQRVRATISADSVRIGERFTVSLTVTHRFNTRVSFPAVMAGPDVFGDVEVLERTPVAERYLESDAPGMRIDSVAYEVTTFALDTARIPALPVQLIAGADTIMLATQPIQLAVRSTVPADAQGVRGLAPLATFPGPRWPWVLLTVVAIVLVAGLIYFWRQHTMEEPSPPRPPPVPDDPPYDVAMRRLNALRQQTDWTEPSAIEAFFVDLSMTLRRYIADRLDVAALERTTGELTRALRNHAVLPPTAVHSVEEVLTTADLVKFADKRPTGREGREAIATAKSALDAIERALPPPAQQTPAPEETTA